MKVAAALAAVMLWQGAVSANEPVVEARHMRYERPVAVSGSGQACAVLDAAVFAHAANESLNDVRLSAHGAEPFVETPFVVTESGTQRADDEAAVVQNLGMRAGDVVFDMVMPKRAYTAVVLDLDAKDFLATAKVTGSDGVGPAAGPVTDLGTFALFDLSSQHLSRSTTLPLQESVFGVLHVTLHVTAAPGAGAQVFGAAMVHGASVPPSREAQTVFADVASSNEFVKKGKMTVATIHVPAHVPVERVSFAVDAHYKGSFLRQVSVKATPDVRPDGEHTEELLSGEISHVDFVQSAGGMAYYPFGHRTEAGEMAIDQTQLGFDAVLEANLQSSATIEIAVQNGDDQPLPLQRVSVGMRQRKICFDAAADAEPYELMYGDEALHAPVYDYARLFVASAGALTGTLGAEISNPGYVARQDMRPYTERHPELVWVGLLAVIGVLGSMALRTARRQKRQPASKG